MALSMMDLHTCSCLYVDSLNNTNLKSSGGFRSFSMRHQTRRLSRIDLSTSFVDSRLMSGLVKRKKQQRRSDKRFKVVSEVAGQYEDNFGDVKLQIMNYFTYKAVRTVLSQLYEMNPPKYRFLYNFIAANKPQDGKRFIRLLAKEQQDLAERVMVTRLHLYGKWIKKCDHEEMYNDISNENLALMRERLMETVIWPSDDNNTEKIG